MNQLLQRVVTNIIKKAPAVKDTYELVGEMLEFPLVDTNSLIDMLELDRTVVNGFSWAIANFKDLKLGPFDTSKYFSIIPSIKKCIAQIKDDSNETRRCVIHFPEEHCFQSIQFLVRENTVNVVCFMRSCNAIKNLPYDIWLCSFLADIFGKHYEDVTGERPYQANKIKMMFGSLHVFREDAKDVL